MEEIRPLPPWPTSPGQWPAGNLLRVAFPTRERAQGHSLSPSLFL